MRLSCLDNLDTLACNLQSQCQSCFLRTSTHWDGKNSLPIAFRSATGGGGGGRRWNASMSWARAGSLCFHVDAAHISGDCNVFSSNTYEVIWSSWTCSWKRRFPVQTRNIWRLKLHQQNRMRKAPAICFKIYKGFKVLEEFCITYVWLIISHF